MSRYPNLARAVDGVHVWADQRPLSASDLSERFDDRIAVVIPAHNEADNLHGVLRRIPERICGVPATVLVVDDGSRDGTTDAALGAGVVVAQLPENRGGGAALWAGYSLMLDASARIVVTMDADGQHRPEELEQVVEPVLSGRAEVSQGSRILGSAEPGAFARELGIAFFNRFVRVLTGVRITDCSNGFRAVSPGVLPELDLRQPQFHAAEFLIEAVTRGFRLEEVPVQVKRRQAGSSKKPPALRYGWGFHSAIIGAWRRALMRGTPRRRIRRAAAAEPAGPEFADA
ncbi:MAG: glycosyltransferase family 2 protein [Solirubrobacteraceae bacterium]